MTPLRDLIARIRWDPAFGRGQFEIAYLDRHKTGLVRMALNRTDMPGGNSFAFEVFDEEGLGRTIPLHRVREVRRDGELIWSRYVPRPARKALATSGPARKGRTGGAGRRLPRRAAR